MRELLVNSLVMVVLVPALLAGWFYAMQPRMVFLGTETVRSTPRDWGLDYESVTLVARDGVRTQAWFVPHAGSHRAVLFFHGNAGNRGDRRDTVEILHRLGLNVFIVDYRGYGGSEGSPDEAGLRADARAAWRHLVEERGFVPGQIVLHGRSLGGVVAAGLAAESTPGALILESTFSSARDFARMAFPWLSWLVVMRYDFDVAADLARVRCPVLMLHSPEDEIIPHALGRRAFEAANEPKTWWALRGDHNGGFLLSQPTYSRTLGRFLDRHLALPSP